MSRNRSTLLLPTYKAPTWSTVLLYTGFIGTGVGVALPGVLLPAFLLQWHLQDEQGGRLFLLGWIGSSLGALIVHGRLRTALSLGCAAIALAATGLALCGGFGAAAWMGLYGLGLGTTMTSVSLIRQQQTLGHGTEMVRLNLAWAIGACLCPSLALRSVSAASSVPILVVMAMFFAAVMVLSVMQQDLNLHGIQTDRDSPPSALGRVPLSLLALTFLVTGIEASAGGWLTTYARRGGYNLAETIAAPTCFWAGLLLSRLFWVVAAERLQEPQIVRLSLVLMSISSISLIATQRGFLVVAAAFSLGFGLGPTYPLLLAWVLRMHRGGTIFFVAGVGSACLPWLTGLVSARQSSLRMGLTVPTAGSCLMLTIALLSPLGTWAAPVAPKTEPDGIPRS